MKCPYCEKGVLQFVCDSVVVFDVVEREDEGEPILAAINPKVTVVFDEERKLECSECGVEYGSEYAHGDTQKHLEGLYERVEIKEDPCDRQIITEAVCDRMKVALESKC